MPAQPKQRFLKLDVNEVSLVDSPANEVEFLVTKNMEDSVMGEQQQTETATNAAERVAVETPAGGEAVEKALAHVNAIVDNVAKAYGKAPAAAPAAEATPAAAPAAPAEAAAETEGEADVEKSTLAGLLKGFGYKMSKEQMDQMKAAGFDPNQKFPTAKPPAAKTTKAAGEPAAAEPTESNEEQMLGQLVAGLTKAKKFTPGRIEKLKGAFETLKALLDDIAEVPAGTNPGVSTPGGSSFGASGVKDLTKSASAGEGSEVLKAIGALAEVVKGLAEGQAKTNEKVEAIEKARPASQSLEGEGGTESKTQKSTNIWGGIL